MNRCGSLALTAAALATMTATGCAVVGTHNVAGKPIRYQVDYQASALDRLSRGALSITYTTNDGPREQSDIELPWMKVVGTLRSGMKPSVKAQFNGYGTIVCRIFADNRLIVELTSPEDPYPVVECTA